MKNMQSNTTRGFTLLQLLVTLAVFAVLASVTVLVVNPVETLRRARDTQRITDLGAIVAAIEQFRADVPDADVRYDKDAVNNHCNGGLGNTWRWVSDSATTDSTVYGGDTTIHATESQAIDGMGWLPVNLTLLPSTPPVSRFPVDPVNNVVNGTSTAASVSDQALMYIYACKETGSDAPSIEIDTNLESARFRNGGSVDKESTDGGDYANIYEVGLSRFIMTAP